MKAALRDQEQRDRAIFERDRNVLVDAGAGTGKTTLLVARLIHLLAPEDDGPHFELDRLAAITFTRRAAGELKLRLRQALLAESARADLSAKRTERLSSALERLDNATLGTVHSFADRLLRLRPADARVSPEYEIAEETDELVWETYRWLLEATEHGTLAGALAACELEGRAEEVAETLRLFQGTGFLMYSIDHEAYTQVGLDWLVRDLIQTRDRDLALVEREPMDLARVRSAVDELGRLVHELSGDTTGTSTLRRLRDKASSLARSNDPAVALRSARAWWAEYRAADLKKGADFPGDDAGWQTWKWLSEGQRGTGKSKEERPGGPLVADLTSPILGWLAGRLVRMRPVVLALYRQVKRAHQVLDQIDLLLELRDLLRNNLDARRFYQQRFDHILVDEFQDTDPLQAEILAFLCERAVSEGAAEGELAPGKLTIVGDPKQSIYRFRRADITMYAEFCERMRRGQVCEAQLSVNFRSTPELINWVNQAFDAVLGVSADGAQYEKSTGAVCNMRLAAGRLDQPAPSIHVLAFGDAALRVEASRDLEGQALARYLRWLVEGSGLCIRDPHTRELRTPRYGDIAVMVVATQTVHHLLDELDALSVPHVVRGGTLFMRDPLHQQFVLGLRALSDRDDGVARAALMRPPFFALSLEEVVRARVADVTVPVSEAMQQFESIERELRFLRHSIAPGEMARAVLERTGFGRFVAAGENGEQRLARLYELCLVFGQRAAELGVDFDGMTAVARGWIDAPIRMEAPLPVDADAVQVITVHQAKGLEWPIVALWDGRAAWSGHLPQPALMVDASSGSWAIALHQLAHDPTARGMRTREMALLANERKRVLYVAATRARDLLIVPEAGEPKDKNMAGKLLLSTGALEMHRAAAYGTGEDTWSHSSPHAPIAGVESRRPDQDAAWMAAANAATRPWLVPSAVSAESHTLGADQLESELPLPRKSRKGRYGAAFGSTVHRALELVLGFGMQDVPRAVEWAAREHGLTSHLLQAREDVARALAALEQSGLSRGPIQLEYPIAGSLEAETLLVGYIDLLVETAQGVVVVDFKTDAPPSGVAALEYPEYAVQVRAYGALLERAGMGGANPIRAALLFTGNGVLHWLS